MGNIGDSETNYIFLTYQKFLDLFSILFKQKLEQDVNGLKNLGQEVGHRCPSNFSSLCEPPGSDKLFSVAGQYYLFCLFRSPHNFLPLRNHTLKTKNA